MSIREVRACRRDPVQVGDDQCSRLARDESSCRVEDVLARGAEMNVLRGVAPDSFTQRAHERLGRVAGAPALGDERGEIEAVGVAAHDDRPGGVPGDDADLRLGDRERALGHEHRAQPGLVRDGSQHFGRREQRVKRHRAPLHLRPLDAPSRFQLPQRGELFAGRLCGDGHAIGDMQTPARGGAGLVGIDSRVHACE